MDDDKVQIHAASPADADHASPPSLDEKTLASSRDLDDTYEEYRKSNVQNIDPQDARRVLRKIDLNILPLLAGTYFLQYLDKSSVNFASVFGLQDGTHLHGQQYAWLSSLFYLGYLVAQPFAGYALQRLPLGKFIGGTTLIWALLTITTPACNNFAGIAANRFLLGVFESVVNPGFVLCLSMWWTQDEQPWRMVLYYCMNGFAGIFGGLLGYAIGHVFMPDIPTTARFLTPFQRILAVERVAQNRQGVKNHHFKQYQVWQCLRDPKTWILFVMAVAAQIPNAAQSSFTSIILKTFGFSTLQTQYMQIPGNAIQIISLLASGFISSRYPNMRCVVMLIDNLICVGAGAALVGLPAGPDGTENKWGRLVALWLCSFQSVGFSMSLTMVSSNVAGYTKKQLTGAILFVGYCVGNVIGPQTFIDSEAPLYTSAYIAILVGYSVKTLLVIVLYLYMWGVNKKRDREMASSGSTLNEEQVKEAIERGMQDVTEIDNKGFRYVL
ncbi:MFS general substrate transporter [Xylariaceae sp. FL1019]|nr:MFS general substrate transporter [Xylariaceae sp. FL1019]